MGIYSTVLACLLGAIIIINEFTRKKSAKPIDLMTGVNIMVFLPFVVAPFYIYFSEMEFSSWTLLVNIENSSPVVAILYVILGYLSLLFGLKFTGKWKFVKKLPNNFYFNTSRIENFGHVIGVLGIFCLGVFIFSIGGLNSFLSTNTLYRSGTIDVSPVAFIRNLALFIPISAQIFYCLSKERGSKWFNKYRLFFALYFLASLLLYFNRATRMGTLLFLFSFLLINVFYYKKSIMRYLPLMVTVLLFFVLYGKKIFNYFVVDDISFETDGEILSKFVGEFSFPFYSLTNAVENSFFDGMPRFFLDFIFGVLNLFPSAFVPFNVPANATQLNTDSFLNMSGIPVDIFSLGFYSFGLSGILIITFSFGVLVGIVEKMLSAKNHPLVVIFYIQFVFFCSLRIPYAGPTNVLKSNLCMLITFACFVLLFQKRTKKERLPN